MYRATFNPTDQMILSASVLWDVRMSSEVHRFGRFAKKGGVFHPYRSEVVIDTKVQTSMSFVACYYQSLTRCWTCGLSKSCKMFPGWGL